jgi:hypothetical protein
VKLAKRVGHGEGDGGSPERQVDEEAERSDGCLGGGGTRGGWHSDERWKREPAREAIGEGQSRRRPRILDENEGERGSPVTCTEEEQGGWWSSPRQEKQSQWGALSPYSVGEGRA